MAEVNIYRPRIQLVYQIQGLTDREDSIVHAMHSAIFDVTKRCSEYAGEQLEFHHIYHAMLKGLESRLPNLDANARAAEFQILQAKTDNLNSSKCEEIIGNYFEYKLGRLDSPI